MRRTWAAIGAALLCACGDEPTVPLLRSPDASVAEPDAGAPACPVEGREPTAAFELASLGARGTFAGLAELGQSAPDTTTVTFDDGQVVSLRLTGAAAGSVPLRERLAARVELDGASASLVLRVAVGVDGGKLRWAAWDTAGALPDVAPYTVRYVPQLCEGRVVSCSARAPAVLVAEHDAILLRVSPLQQDHLAAAAVVNGDSDQPADAPCPHAAPRLRGLIDEYHAPVTNPCVEAGEPNDRAVILGPPAFEMGARALEGVATASVTGDALGVRFEDGRTVELRIGGAAAASLPRGGRWRARVTYRASNGGNEATLVLRSTEGAEPGLLRYAAWETSGALPDVAPFELSYTQESCGVITESRCTTTGPQTLWVQRGDRVTQVSSEHHLTLADATIINGRSRYVVASPCGEGAPRVSGVIVAR